MSTLASTAMTRLLTILLIASVSVCCCQARAMAAHSAADLQGCSAASQGAPGCCAKTNSDSNEQNENESGCCDCCLKATHLQSSGSPLPKLLTADVTAIAGCDDVHRLARMGVVPIVRSPDFERCVSDLPTLLRLRCALII